MAAAVTVPFVPTNSFKSFGEYGPKYQVGKPVRQLPDGDWMVGIVLIESGEEAEYPLSQIMNDPQAV